MNDLQLAQQCADAMHANDKCRETLDVEVLPIETVGQSTCKMTVNDTMTNGYDICFGGFIFSLADIAFAYACNAYNNVSVAQHCSITFIRPAFIGDVLTAHAVERSRGKRSGIYDITVTNQNGKTIAEFRGNSSALGDTIIKT